MFPRVLKAVSLATSAVLAGALLTVVSFAAPPTAQDTAAAAPPASAFDPGFIISDSVMFDFGAMSLDGIQSFLNAKVPTCDPAAAAPCLKDYHVDTHDIAAVANRCTGNITGAPSQSAAQIIYAVSRACEVNPKVLLVTLQKEQGLVTSTSPTDGKYKIAMGYGCPDTAPCDSDYYGFFNQVYQAAYAFNKYTKSPDQYTAYQPGVRKIQYKPNSSCGTATVNIQTKATGALYFYTPYVPNAAALNNPYGTGDSCSSYGNRNFWVYFNDWFGSPMGGSFLIDTADGHTYVLINGTRWEIPAARAGLIATLAPLGAVGRVSNTYADRFAAGGVFSNLVVDGTGNLFLLDSGHRYTIADCVQAADFGFSCAGAPTMTDDMLAFFPIAGPLSTFVSTPTGAQFHLGGGQKRELLDAASATAAAIALAPASAVAADTIATVPYGAPIARPGALASVRGDTNQYFLTPSASYQIDPSLLKQSGLGARLGGSAGSLDPASLALLPAVVPFHGIFAEPATGATYVLTKTGKAQVTDPKEWGAKFVSVDPLLSTPIPVVGSYSAPLFVKDLTTTKKFLLKSGKRRPVSTNSQMKALAKAVGAKNSALTLPGDVASMLGKPFVKPGSVVRSSKKSTLLWLIDGASKKRPITTSEAKEITGSTRTTIVASATLDGFTTVKGAAKPGLYAAGVSYVADSGVLRVVSAASAKQFGTKFGFGHYDVTTVAALKHGAAIGRVIKSGSKYYQVKNGKKLHVSTAAAKKLAKTAGAPIQPVSKYLASLLPTK